MNRRNMRYIEAEIKHSRSDLLSKSNKNLTADTLKEVAESLGLNIAYLHEDFNLRKEFAIREEDVELVKTMVKLAKTKEGKQLRCKSFTESNVECINTVVESFMTLFAHNGVADEKIFEEWLAVMRQTDFLLLKKYVAEQTSKFDEELNQYFFAPNERFENEDDRLSEIDKLVFFGYLLKHLHLTKNEIRGIYWCFSMYCEARDNQEMITSLRSVTPNEKEKMLEDIRKTVSFEFELNMNEDYQNSLQELLMIESGRGKLQDVKKKRKIIEEMVDVMDEVADKQSLDAYTYGLPTPKDKKIKDYDSLVEDSRRLLYKAVSYYCGMKKEREKSPVDQEEESILEYLYEQRFGSTMFE